MEKNDSNISNSDTVYDSNVKLHLQEAEDLKKEWFSYVLGNIEGLHSKIDTVSDNIAKEKSSVIEKLENLRRDLREQLISSDNSKSKYLEKVEERLQRIIDSMQLKLDNINPSNIKLQVDQGVETAKSDVEQSVEKYKDGTTKEFKEFKDNLTDQLKVLNDSQLVIKTKLGLYAFLMSIITTTIVTGIIGAILIIFEGSIKAFLGL